VTKRRRVEKKTTKKNYDDQEAFSRSESGTCVCEAFIMICHYIHSIALLSCMCMFTEKENGSLVAAVESGEDEDEEGYGGGDRTVEMVLASCQQKLLP
jgi:hypothetical protein